MEKLKDKVLTDLHNDAIIIVKGSFFMDGKAMCDVFSPSYQLLPPDFPKEHARQLFMDLERLKRFKNHYSDYPFLEDYVD